MKTRRPLVLAALLAAAALAPGCRSLGSNAADGAVIGGALGAGGGYAIGHHRGNRTNWTLAGAVAGAMAGWIVGDQMDDRERATVPDPAVRSTNGAWGAPCGPAPDRVIVRDECDPVPPGW